MLKRILSLLTFLLVFVCSAAPLAAGEPDLDNYTGAKFEPAKGTYLGAYVVQDESINGNMETFNEITGKKHASFFRYVGYGQPFPKEWVEEVKAVGAIPQIAWEPNNGLDAVQDDEYLRTFAQEAAESDVPIFLRYASESNGDWTAYHGDADKYIEKWRLVHKVMAEEAPNVAMVWTVFTFPQGQILEYYPGDDYVDWVGVNVYNVVYHNGNINHFAADEDPLELLDYVYKTFSDRKPIHISEWGVTHYTITDGNYYVKWANNKLKRMYEGIRDEYPRVKAIYYFDVNNLVNAPEGRKINDYSLTSDPEKLQAYSNLTADSHYLSDFLDNTAHVLIDGKKVDLGNGLIRTADSTYLPIRPLADQMGCGIAFEQGRLTLKQADGQKIILTANSKKALVNGYEVTLDKAPINYQHRIFIELAELEKLFSKEFSLAE